MTTIEQLRKEHEELLWQIYSAHEEPHSSEAVIKAGLDNFDKAIQLTKEDYKDICSKCRGKGYSTQLEFVGGFDEFNGKEVKAQAPYYLPCDCERGKQFKEAIEKTVQLTKEADCQILEDIIQKERFAGAPHALNEAIKAIRQERTEGA